MQQNRADTLRRRIELYRRLLSKGVNADLARVYLFEIAEAELELAELLKPANEGLGRALLTALGSQADDRVLW